MKPFLYPCLFVLMTTLSARALVGNWISFTKVSDVRDMQAYEGAIWVATTGGIRRAPLDGGAETVFRNTEGLIDISIQSLTATPDGNLWAASELGLLYRLKPDRTRWEVFGASYKAAGWRMRKRALYYRAPYLILGSDKGLSFFNAAKGIAEANLTRMGAEKGLSVNSLAMVGDTLFAGTSKGIFRATLRMDRLLTDPTVNIFNPDIWTRIPGTETGLFHHPGQPRPDTAVADSVAGDSTTLPSDASADSAHGLLYYTEAGIASDYEGAVASDGSRISRYGRMILDGEEHPNPWQMSVLERAGNRWFQGHKVGFFEYFTHTKGSIGRKSEWDLPEESITMIEATPHGVYALGAPKAFKLRNGRWEELPGFDRFSDKVDANRNGSHPFHVLGEDEVYWGTWGFGLYAYSRGGGRAFESGEGKTCLESAVEKAPAYSVIIAQTPYLRQGFFLATLHDGRPFKLAYYDIAEASITCFPVETRDSYPLSLEVIGGDLLVAVAEGGISTFRIRNRDGRVTLDPGNLTASLRSPEPTKVGLSDAFGNLWVTSGGGNMYFVPGMGGGEWKDAEFKTLDGFPGRECKSIDRDARGHIWVGCVSGGIVEITPGRDSLTHAFRRYGVNDGLLSENVYHLSVDSSSGHVWVVTDRGIARFESPSRPATRTLSAARVYPNPFLAKHSQVIFDGLAEGSEIRILTQGGSVLFSRRLGPADGNQIRWDGRNLSGAKITEGVYFYVIRSPKDLKRGKLIVGR